MKQILLTLLFLCNLVPNIAAGVVDDFSRFQKARNEMIRDTIVKRGIRDPRVLRAMQDVPRHYFVPENLINRAYRDTALPIGDGQTISQPYIVALMTASLKLNHQQRVLEIGTGSGYQAAVLAKIVKEVYTVEIKKKTARQFNPIVRETWLHQYKNPSG